MHAKKIAIIVNTLVCALFLFCAAGARLAAQTQALPPNLADAFATPIVTIMDKTEVPAGLSRHDYVSYARYYWPDPSKPGGMPFIMRDGDPNTDEIARGDYARLWTFFDTVESLTNAWRANHDAAAARRAGEWLRAWLIAPATRMNPNLDYAQIRLGSDNNHGSVDGVTDGRGFGRIIGDIKDLDSARVLTAADKEALGQWFNAYLEWLMTSKNGMAARAAQNSGGTWFVAQTLPIADYVGRDYLARALSEEAQKRIAIQIQRDGSQPQEMRRINSLSSSAFNLAAYAQIAQAVAPLGVDLWNYTAPSLSSLGKAVDFLVPYNMNPSAWPHPQREPMQSGFLSEIIKARGTPLKVGIPKIVALPPPPPPPPPAVTATQSQNISNVPIIPSISSAPSAPSVSGASNTPNTVSVSSASSASSAPYTPNVFGASNVSNVSNASNVSNVSNVSNGPASVIIVLQKDGSIFFNGKMASDKQLESLLSQVRAISPNIPVFISMEGNAPIRTLASVMETCRRQGLNKISMQTQ